MHWTPQDTGGAVVAFAINLVPIAVFSLFADSLSKEPSLSAHYLPCSAALLAATLASVVAYRYGWGKRDRIGYYALFGAAALFVVIALFCGVSWFDVSNRPPA